MRSTSAATALAVLFSSVALSVAVTGQASAAVATVQAPGGMVVDGTLKRVFVGDSGNGRVVAANYAGTVLDSVGGFGSVADLALSDDGRTLYASLPARHQIVALDAATLDIKARYTVATGSGPRYLAFTSGKLWFSYGDQWDGNLGSVDPHWTGTPDPLPETSPSPTPTSVPTSEPPSAEPTAPPSEPPTSPAPDPSDDPSTDPSTDPEPEPSADSPAPDAPSVAALAAGDSPVSMGQLPAGHSLWNPALLDASTAAPGLLALGETGSSSSTVGVVDVSGAAPTMVAWNSNSYELNNGIHDLDLVPGAPEVLADGTDRDAYANGTLKKVGAYPGGQSADIAPDGLVAQVNGAGTKVAVYRPNATRPLRTYTTSTYDTADLAWAPDSSRVFALAGASGGYTLKVLTDPTRNVPTLTVNAPSNATRAKKLTVSGKLSATVALPAGVKLSVTRTDLETPNGRALPSVTVKANGTYSFTNTPPVGGTVTYKVSYSGDATHAPVTVSDRVAVSRAASTLTLNNNKKVYDYGTDVRFTAHLGRTYKNRTVEIWVDPHGSDRPKKLVKNAKVNSAGNLSVVVDMTRDTNVTAVYRGDARFAPKTVKVTSNARVRISTAVSRHYKTAKIGSTSYYWFHKNTNPVLTTAMSYYPGRQQRFDFQVYFEGTWYSGDSEYFSLATNGKSAVELLAPGESGIRARVRSSYVDGASGDNVNSTTIGPWKYLYFSN
ncbi:Ig-like domain repeat protein [Streptomyces sp. WI04-05B]|uniref:Ig-like domain repeat protein n=1 Tax=Streptomyces TaxID=1883 RepID=UPI0029A91A7C|nr:MULTISPECIES: Ig-like domain repeat protein [unclassified Streptomyces]MDX2543035.1 Ig-like domain repeat protein [Streptomyces sp. WI04-05B]MDX2589387.1 Ig-like domain repeat protein [Streptomyces sp. WI04-05A]